MKLFPSDQIVTAWSEGFSGPGWSNRLVLVIVRDTMTGKLREESLQPSEQTDAMHILAAISEAMHGEMVAAVKEIAGKHQA